MNVTKKKVAVGFILGLVGVVVAIAIYLQFFVG